MDSASDDGFRGVRRLEVVETGRRRRWADETKIRFVEETFEAGVSMSSVARRHGIAPTQLYEWRKRFFPQATRTRGGFAPVVVTPDPPVMAMVSRMEVVSRNGRRIIVDRDVDVAVLLRVLAGLEQ